MSKESMDIGSAQNIFAGVQNGFHFCVKFPELFEITQDAGILPPQAYREMLTHDIDVNERVRECLEGGFDQILDGFVEYLGEDFRDDIERVLELSKVELEKIRWGNPSMERLYGRRLDPYKPRKFIKLIRSKYSQYCIDDGSVEDQSVDEKNYCVEYPHIAVQVVSDFFNHCVKRKQVFIQDSGSEGIYYANYYNYAEIIGYFREFEPSPEEKGLCKRILIGFFYKVAENVEFLESDIPAKDIGWCGENQDALIEFLLENFSNYFKGEFADDDEVFEAFKELIIFLLDKIDSDVDMFIDLRQGYSNVDKSAVMTRIWRHLNISGLSDFWNLESAHSLPKVKRKEIVHLFQDFFNRPMGSKTY